MAAVLTEIVHGVRILDDKIVEETGELGEPASVVRKGLERSIERVVPCDANQFPVVVYSGDVGLESEGRIERSVLPILESKAVSYGLSNIVQADDVAAV